MHAGRASGRQVRLVREEQRATIVEVGGGLREYEVGGTSVIDGYSAAEMCRGGRGQVLAPWPNRIDGGRYRWAGVELQLPLNEVARSNANHGLVRWANWSIVRADSTSAAVATVLYPQPGYPFTLALRIEYQLCATGLTVATAARNDGDRTLPFGIGFHPYLTVGTERIDAAVLTAPAAQRLETDARGIPTGRVLEVGEGDRDFRSPAAIGVRALDDCYTAFARDDDGLARITLAAPDSSRSAAVWMDESFPYAMLFSGDTLALDERRRSLAVEPMSCPPNAFVSGEAVAVLEPGEERSYRWGIEPSGAT